MSTMIADIYPEDACDLCGADGLWAAYKAQNSRRGLTVCVCPSCGLIQSLPRVARVVDRTRRISSGADWGNVRYGKGFRVGPAIDALTPFIDPDATLSVLDVGSNRGGFCLAFAERCKAARFRAIEPDPSVVDAYADKPAVALNLCRVEDADLPADTYDVIHCSHTLEHLGDPLRQLTRLAASLKPSGVMYLEVPNSQILRRDDLIEEWFIDKHLFHFSRAAFLDLLRRSGLSVVEGTLLDTDDFLGAVVRRAKAADVPQERDSPEEVLAMVRAYDARLKGNIARLKQAADAIAALSPMRVIFWGAGRIFQSFMMASGFDPKNAVGAIDKELWRYVETMEGMPISKPEDLQRLKPDVVIVMSRQFHDEIKASVEAVLSDCEVRSFTDFIPEASDGNSG